MIKNGYQKKLTEITQSKTRNEEEKFYVKFSETQLNAVLLLILANTFFAQGATTFLESLPIADFTMKVWFFIVVISLLFLVMSVGLITVGGVLSGLRLKRIFNLSSFFAFLIGIFSFVCSLAYIMLLLFNGY